MRRYRRVPPEARRTRLTALYDRYADAVGLDQLVSRWELARALDELTDAEIVVPAYVDGAVPARLRFVMATSKAIVLWQDGRAHLLSAGRQFGLSLSQDQLFAFQVTGLHGRVVSMPLTAGGPRRLTTHLYGFDRWIHQLDFVDDELVVVDTLHNRLLCYAEVGSARARHFASADRVVQLSTPDRRGRLSPHYRHFNSIYRHGGSIYLMAHNHSSVTGRQSEIWVLDERWRPQRLLATGGHCCHNVIQHERGLLFCRSIEQTLVVDGVDVLRTSGFTRGLAYDGRHVLVGSSTFAVDFADRDHDDGVVHVLDADFNPLGSIVLPRTSIRDIRLLSGDRGLSNSAHSRLCRNASTPADAPNKR